MKMLSVSQYAKRCGETTRNIYNRLKTDLKDKAVKQDGKWFIMVDDETPTQEATPQPTPPREEDTETLLRQMEKELAEKEKQITEMLQEVIKLTNQAQILTAQAQKQVLHLTTTNAAQEERIHYLEGEVRQYQERKPWYKRIFDKTKRDGK